jgi:acetyltransferase
LVSKNNAIAVDARIILKHNLIKSPRHLVISPYPDQYESHALSKDGEKFFIRPIRPEDAPLLVEHFNSLSPQTIYRRFFSPLKVLPHSMLARFTQIDYDREIALVALSEFGNKEKMLGVARVINEPDQINAEFSVVVADKYQGKGIGAALLWCCLQIAKTRGIEIVYGLVLAENTQMLALGRKLGFDIKKVPGEPEYRLIIDTKKL